MKDNLTNEKQQYTAIYMCNIKCKRVYKIGEIYDKYKYQNLRKD
jgi:hypothetical protein